MADFVAVIRKAVEGLANNTPETRSKVYEKARSAVLRQLENMKPRPPEELLTRQIAKLDAAISEVESEYAEALPPLDDEELDDLPLQEDLAPYEAPYSAQEQEEAPVEETYAYEPAPIEEPVAPVYEPVQQPYDDVAVEPETESEPTAHGSFEVEPAHPVQSDYYEPAPSVDEPYQSSVSVEQDEPQEHAHANWVGSDTVQEPEWEANYPDVPEDQYATQWTPNQEPVDTSASETTPADDDLSQTFTSANQYQQDVQTSISEPSFDQVVADRQALDAAADDIFGTQSSYHDDDRALEEEERRLSSGQSPDFGSVGTAIGAGAAAAAGAGLAGASTVNSPDFTRYFDEALDKSNETAKGTESPSLPRADSDPFAPQSDDKKRDAWDDFDDLINYTGNSGQTSDGASTAVGDDTVRGDTTIIPPNVYVKPKKNRTKELILGSVATLLIAGLGYVVWENRAAFNDMFGGLTESAHVEPAASTSGDAASNTPTVEGTATGGPAPSSDGASNGETTGTKFTQRLLPDGTEKDEGPAPVSSNQPVTAEGVSQMEQNVAPSDQTQTDATPATEPPPDAAPATQTPAVAVAGERMFLYEEVLGQSVPNAIAGTSAWSLVNEQDANGKPLPTVQAQLSVPDRGITALLTFKKNTDASLPASHIIEVVFSTGPGFDGGVIDSVQRIAMKRTEEDRGNALIAVPAKITDDFHMIALNDFPDARATNMDLLKNRDWIDIPIAYRNGRRALLTLQKGPAGKQAFETAIREWDASTPASQ